MHTFYVNRACTPYVTVYLGLARTIYIRCIYAIFGGEITKYTVIYGVYIRFWPTLRISDEISACNIKYHVYTRRRNPWRRRNSCIKYLYTPCIWFWPTLNILYSCTPHSHSYSIHLHTVHHLRANTIALP